MKYTCNKCNEEIDDVYNSGVFVTIDGERKYYHLGHTEDPSKFKEWKAIIMFDYDDGEYREPGILPSTIYADSEENAIETAIMNLKPEQEDGAYAYELAVFPKSKWKRVEIRKHGSEQLLSQ